MLPAWALYAERPTRQGVVGLAVGFAGLVIVAIPGGGGSGAALSLGAAGAATVGTLIARRLGTLDNVVAGGWSLHLGGAGLALWAGLAEGTPAIHWSLGFVGILTFLGVLGMAAVYVAWFKEARRRPLYRLAAWTFPVPLFGLVLSVVLENERPTAWTAGLSVVLMSMWLVLRSGMHTDPKKTRARGVAWETGTRHTADRMRSAPRTRKNTAESVDDSAL
ncbi:MAG: DMT family transporter [Hyphomicrobiales bacterium]